WASSSSNAFAVGDTGTVAHYDGASWQEMTVPVASDLDVTAVWGLREDQVYAVGENGTLLIFDGSAWSAVTHSYHPYFTGVWAAGPEEVILVGDGGVYGYDGSGIDLRAFDPGWWLWDVWGSSDSDIFAVGELGLILHYDGVAWSEMDSGTEQTLNAVWGSSPENVFAVGNGGVILRFDGDAWSPLASGTEIDLKDVHGANDVDIYVVAFGSTLLRYTKRSQ
ncbi:MAG: glucosyltransferase-I, partial [bacterium]